MKITNIFEAKEALNALNRSGFNKEELIEVLFEVNQSIISTLKLEPNEKLHLLYEMENRLFEDIKPNHGYDYNDVILQIDKKITFEEAQYVLDQWEGPGNTWGESDFQFYIGEFANKYIKEYRKNKRLENKKTNIKK